VSSYIRNLNTHRSYRDLRRLRAQLRRRALPLSGMLLAEGLRRYSERGDRYVREVQSLIRQNGLESASFRTAVTGS
jgi:Bax protein